MKHPSRLRRDVARPGNARSARPGLEALEGRQLLATLSGGKWTYPGLITYSFMPDGTSVGGTPSNLFQSLNLVAPTATWQQQFQKAAAVWAAVANINIALVSDNGTPVGGDGYQQGDSRFGDIRIGATSQSPGVLAYALSPPPINGGSDAGDIVLNSSIAWKINNDYDLETVAIHEFGHALGLGHSAITSAVMYAYYTNMKQGLTGDDAAGIQALYGPVPAPDGNTTSAAAMDLTPMLNTQAQLTLGGQYIASATNLEWYKVTVPAGTSGTMNVVMQSSGLSSLSPRLAVYNSAMAAVGQAVVPNSYGSTATFTVSGVSPGQVYYVRASSANTGPSAVGAFALQVNLGSAPLPAVPAPNTTVLAQPDAGVNMLFDTTSTSNSGSGSSSSGKKGSGDGDCQGGDGGDRPALLQVGNLSAWGDDLTVGDLAHGSAGERQSEAGDDDPRWTGSTQLFAGLDAGVPPGQFIAGPTDIVGAAGKTATPSQSALASLDSVLSEWQRKHTFGGL